MELKTFARADDAPGGAAPASPSNGGGGADTTPAAPGNGGTGPGAGDQPQQAQQPAARFDFQGFSPHLQAFHGELKEPQFPTKFEDMQTYERSRQGYERGRAFQSGLNNLFQTPVQVGDGVTLAFTSNEEAHGFLRYLDEVRSGRRQLSPQDLLVLHRLPSILKMAQDHGARTFEKSRGGGAGPQRDANNPQRQAADTKVVVPPKEEPQPKGNGKGPSIAELFKKQDPEGYENFIAGKVSLT